MSADRGQDSSPQAGRISSTNRSRGDSGGICAASESHSRAAQPDGSLDAFRLRVEAAARDALQAPAVNVDNGDYELCPDKADTFTTTPPHDSFVRVNLDAFATFTRHFKPENLPISKRSPRAAPAAGVCFDQESMDHMQDGQSQMPSAPWHDSGATVAGSCRRAGDGPLSVGGGFVIPIRWSLQRRRFAGTVHTGADAGQIKVNGELNKMAHNVSFRHSIHAGIHWRSDTDTSLL